MPEGKLAGTIPNGYFAMTRALFLPDGQTLMLTGHDDTLFFWKPPFKAPFHTLRKIGSGLCTRPAFSPDGKLLAVGWNQYQGLTPQEFTPKETFLRLISLPDGKEVLRLTREKEMDSLAFSPDGNMLAIKEKGDKAHFELVSVPSGETLARWPGGGFLLGFSADGSLLASRRWSVLDLWSIPSGNPYPAPNIPLEKYGSALAVFSPDGKWLALASSRHAIQLLAKPYAVAVMELRGHTFEVKTLAFSPDSKYLASGLEDGAIFLWKLEEEGVTFHAALYDPLAIWSGTEFAHASRTGGGTFHAALYDPLAIWSGTEFAHASRTGGGTFHAALYDPLATWSGTEFAHASRTGGGTFIGACGSTLPLGAVCTCNCVSGTSPNKQDMPGGGGGGGGGFCSCNRICTCVPVK